MSTDIDMRTPAQRAKDERQDRVCARFRELYAHHPESSLHRIICTIADEVGMTYQGVKDILIARGIYVTSSERKPRIVLGGQAL